MKTYNSLEVISRNKHLMICLLVLQFSFLLHWLLIVQNKSTKLFHTSSLLSQEILEVYNKLLIFYSHILGSISVLNSIALILFQECLYIRIKRCNLAFYTFCFSRQFLQLLAIYVQINALVRENLNVLEIRNFWIKVKKDLMTILK